MRGIFHSPCTETREAALLGKSYDDAISANRYFSPGGWPGSAAKKNKQIFCILYILIFVWGGGLGEVHSEVIRDF